MIFWSRFLFLPRLNLITCIVSVLPPLTIFPRLMFCNTARCDVELWQERWRFNFDCGRARVTDARARNREPDDNASGTAGVIELARYFQSNKRQEKNNLFAASTQDRPTLRAV